MFGTGQRAVHRIRHVCGHSKARDDGSVRHITHELSVVFVVGLYYKNIGMHFRTLLARMHIRDAGQRGPIGYTGKIHRPRQGPRPS